MRFGRDDNADASSVEDRRGFPGGRVGIAGGGLGLVGIVVVMLVRLLGGDVDVGSAPSSAGQTAPQGTNPGAQRTPATSLGGSCEGVTSGTDQAKFVACVETNVQAFWRGELAKSSKPYAMAPLVLFTDRTQSACGVAGGR